MQPTDPQTRSVPSTPTKLTPSTKPPRNILDLPQELLDIIFTYTYSANNEKTVTARRKNRTKYTYTYEPRPLLDATIDKWLVNKKWFVNAARAFLENREVSVRPTEDPTTGDAVLAGSGGVLHAYATRVKADVRIIGATRKFVAKYPRLRELKCTVDSSYLGGAEMDLSIGGELPYVYRRLEDGEVRESEAYRRISALGRLKKVEVVARNVEELRYPEFEFNLKRLGELLKEDLKTRPKSASETVSDAGRVPAFMPLYVGSEVSFDSQEGQTRRRKARKPRTKSSSIPSTPRNSAGLGEALEGSELLQAPISKRYGTLEVITREMAKKKAKAKAKAKASAAVAASDTSEEEGSKVTQQGEKQSDDTGTTDGWILLGWLLLWWYWLVCG